MKKLDGFGIHSSETEFLTPPVAAGQWLKANNIHDIAVFVPELTRLEFSGFNLKSGVDDTVEAVIIGDLGESWTFATMNHIFRLLINNPRAKLIALGMTRYWKSDNGLQLDVGPMIKAFEYATGVDAIVTGKPAMDFYQAAVTLLGKNDNIVMMYAEIYRLLNKPA